jgi:hypothetical protein
MARGADAATPDARRRRASLRVATTVFAAALPGVLTYVLVHRWLHASIGDFVPNVWNDQVGYWHRISSFAEVGFDTGYYSPDEVALPHDAIRYGVNGPWFAMVYGSVAMIVGWGFATSVYLNIVVLTLAVIAFAMLANLGPSRTLVAGLALAVSWPVLLYVPTSSQESFQQAIAIVLAGVFYRAVQRGPELSAAEKVLGVALLTAASVLRYSWALLFPVLILLLVRPVTARRVVAGITVGVVAAYGAAALTTILQPAGYNQGTALLDRVRADPVAGVSTVVRTTWTNLELLLYPGALDPTAPTFVIRGSLDATGLQSWEIVGLTVLALLAALDATGRIRVASVLRDVPLREALFHVVNLGVVTLAALAFYLPNGYYRVLGAHLLLSVLLLVAIGRLRIVLVIVLLNLVWFPSFLNAYQTWGANFGLDHARIARERATVAARIRHDARARNPWCNTLLLPLEVYDWRVMLVPAGLGIAYGTAPSFAAHPKSRYLFLPREPFQVKLALDRSALREVVSVPAGTFYENRKSRCFRSQP